MAAKFTMDPGDTGANLSTADAEVAQQSGSSLESLAVRGYMTSLVGAVLGARAVKQARTEVRAAANAGTTEFSIATVQTTEAGNTGVLTT